MDELENKKGVTFSDLDNAIDWSSKDKEVLVCMSDDTYGTGFTPKIFETTDKIYVVGIK